MQSSLLGVQTKNMLPSNKLISFFNIQQFDPGRNLKDNTSARSVAIATSNSPSVPAAARLPAKSALPADSSRAIPTTINASVQSSGGNSGSPMAADGLANAWHGRKAGTPSRNCIRCCTANAPSTHLSSGTKGSTSLPALLSPAPQRRQARSEYSRRYAASPLIA